MEIITVLAGLLSYHLVIGGVSKACSHRNLSWSLSFLVGATAGAAFASLVFFWGFISQNQLPTVDGNITWTVLIFLGIVFVAGLRCADSAAGSFFD